MTIELPPAPRPLGAYATAARAGNLLFLAGMLPVRAGAPAHTGIIGADLSVEQGREAVRIALFNGLSAAASQAGSLDAIRVVRLAVYQRTTADFTAHAAVADCASELLRELLGSRGEHARLVFGVQSLPAGMPVELELILEVINK